MNSRTKGKRRAELLTGVDSSRKRYKIRGLLVIDRYYIVDLRDILRPRYIPKPLSSVKEAVFIINCFLEGNHTRYVVETGKTIATYQIKPYRKFMRNIVRKSVIDLKYNYPVDCTTQQKKKDFRTMARRRMRRWIEKLEKG